MSAALRMTLDAPAPPAPPRPHAAGPLFRNSYEAGQFVRRTSAWRAPASFPNDVLAQLGTLRDRSHAAVRNDGYAKGIIDKLVANVVGTGIKPLSKAAAPELRPLIQQRWTEWTDESDADGLLDLYGQQAQAVRTWFEAGDSYTRIRYRLASDGLAVPLQLQNLEPEFCPHTYNTVLPNGNRVRAGVEYSAIGKQIAFYFYASRPGDIQDIDTSQLRRVPAEQVIHLYDPLRSGQLRGIPHLTQALVRLFELRKMTDAVLLKQQLGNMFVGFLRRGPAANDAIHPLTGQPNDTTYGPKPLITLEPGTFQELEVGEEVEWSEPPDVGATYKDFVREELQGISASVGVPYELITGDMSGLNDRVVRVLLNEFAARIEAWQHQIVVFQWCRRVYRAFMDRAYLSGAIPIPDSYLTDHRPFTAVKFTPPRRRYLHPVQDVDSQKAAIRNGFTSRAAVVSEWGEDAETIDAEQAADNARADGFDLRYDSDGRVTPSAAAAAAPPAPPDDDPPAPAQTGE